MTMNTRQNHHSHRAPTLVLIGLAVSGTGVAESDLHSAGLFARAEVTGPDSAFVTQVMSHPDGLILTQHDARGVQLAAGFDAYGTWLFDPATGEVRAIGDRWQVFLIGHDLHRLWLAPETRWARAGGHFADTAGRQASFGRRRNGRPTRLEMRDEENQRVGVRFSRTVPGSLFREAVIETGGGDYVYNYTVTNPIAGEYGIGPDETPARIELLRLHRLHRMAHLGELPLLLAGSALPLVEVSAGIVEEIAPSDLLRRFTEYFDSAEIADWRDRAAPVLIVSDDTTLASKVVQKTVAAASAGGVREQEFAWLETWRRRDGAWRLIAIASTRAGD